MKVVCIRNIFNNQTKLHLTINKTYYVLATNLDKPIDSINNDTYIYKIKDDIGKNAYIPIRYFLTIKQFREQQINKILDNNHESSM